MATQRIKTTFQVRRGRLENWNRVNPVLATGEPGFATDANIIKFGDGITPWKDLEPVGYTDFQVIDGNTDIFLEDETDG